MLLYWREMGALGMKSGRCSVVVGRSAGQTLPFGHADIRQDSVLDHTHEIEVRHL